MVIGENIKPNQLSALAFAINNRCVIQIKHRGVWRTVEPFMTGLRCDTQCLGLWGYCRDVVPQDGNGQCRWQFFAVEEIDHLEMTLYSFEVRYDFLDYCKWLDPVYAVFKP
ncbi:hypothetical protein ACFSUS_23545 [Spirosoma soli]|uniref:Uncharacterized protein n=1 Tax=Spirosoma soli TaxID=1770529 RepID=A0ABW5MAZ4_9BACT